MRSLVLRDRRKFWPYTVSLLAITTVVAGCSTDFDRFSRSALPTEAQTGVSNEYPAGVDPTTTASVSKRVVPAGNIGGGTLATTPQGVYHRPEPMYAASAKPAPVQTYQNPYPAAKQQAVTQKTDLPSPIKLAAPKPQPVSYQTPASTAPQPQNVSYQTTASVAPQPLVASQPTPAIVAPQTTHTKPVTTNPAITPLASYEPPKETQAPVAPQIDSQTTASGGWSDGNGTRYQVKPGETLYNLSKRFGVPVSALMAANSIEDSNDIQAGQIIAIPNYHYAETAPVSAPDSNPNTRAARASTGLLGEANPWQNVVPTRRPIQTASLGNSNYQVATPKPETSSQANVVSKGKHRVQAGDSLSKIATAHGVTTQHLKQANGLSSDTIRIGQTLTIPGGHGTQIASNTTPAPQGVSTITTGSIKKQDRTKIETPVVKQESKTEVTSNQVTPKSSGISQFRWPVKGRVVTKFGEKDGSQSNDGIDISVPEGTAVRSAENGVVIYAGNDIESYGNLLLVRHDNDWVSAYAHNKSFDVKRGDSIRRGQIIARSGRTGHAKQPKLHFELRKNSEPVNPLQHLSRI